MNNENSMEMNEQLAYMQQNEMEIAAGSIIKGTIFSINDKEAYVTLSSKYEGYLPKEEVTKDDSVKLTDLFKIGDEVEAKIIRRKNDHGYVVLSRVEIERDEASKDVKAAFESGSLLKVLVKQAVNGGVVSSYRGVRIFIPASHLDLHRVNNVEQFVGKEYEVKIIEFKQDRRGNKIVGSRREILQAQRDTKQATAWSTVEAHSIVEGEVKRLTDFGAFVDVNGIDGLLHISELSYGRIKKPSDLLKVGDRIKVYVLSADKENRKLALSLKKLSEDPWANIEAKYPVGNIVQGKIVRFADFGAFVELEPGIDGLVHISQISNTRIEKPSDVLKLGDTVKVKILDVNKETKKIGLTIKDVEDI
jgi:4-hydroxy-3-methylbut-2-enyl diphosphate reductase